MTPEQWTVLVAALIGAALTLIPLITTLIKVWIQIRINQLSIANRPTHDEVQTAIDSAITQTLGNGTPNQKGQ